MPKNVYRLWYHILPVPSVCVLTIQTVLQCIFFNCCVRTTISISDAKKTCFFQISSQREVSSSRKYVLSHRWQFDSLICLKKVQPCLPVKKDTLNGNGVTVSDYKYAVRVKWHDVTNSVLFRYQLWIETPNGENISNNSVLFQVRVLDVENGCQNVGSNSL